jgi:hypothetical protein
MGTWSVGDGDAEMLIEPTGDGRISVSIPSGKRIVVSPETAEEIRLLLATAIGVVRGATTA